MKLVKLLANLGYGSRRDVTALLRDGAFTDTDGNPIDEDARLPHEAILYDGEPLDPAPGVLVALHKPVGYTCSTRDAGRIVYDLFPTRFRYRNPALSTVGRLDRETSGLLLLTDDGALLHRIISPKSNIAKVYEATLAQDLRGDETATFAAGTLMLENEKTPLLPAELDVLGANRARLTLHEGRYHQVRRMFAAIGNHVEALHRSAVGGLDLGDLPAGQWRILGEADRAVVFGGRR